MVNALRKRKAELERFMSLCNEFLASAPEGKLRISLYKDKAKFFHRLEDRSLKYLSSRTSQETIRKLAQKDYCQKALRDCARELSKIEALLKEKEQQPVARIYGRLCPIRQNLVSPLEDTLQNRLKSWLEQKTPRLEIHRDSMTRMTMKGELVRSAVEKSIADCLYLNKIPYKYEAQFITRDKRILYPDFMVWQPGTGRILLWEHFGMMDRHEYVGRFMDKLSSYSSCGIFPGNGLIVTFSDSYKGLAQEELNAIMDKVILRR